MKPDLRADYKIRLYTGPKTLFFEVSTLVQPDGSYETVPLEKDVITLKVIQTTVKSLSEYPAIEEGLEKNLAHMKAMAEKACITGNEPDILLYHEFPLTGYSSGTREEKLKYTVQMPGPETDFMGQIARATATPILSSDLTRRMMIGPAISCP